MECVVEKNILTEAVSRAEKVTARNTSLPVLKCLLLTVSEDTLIIRGTNLDIGIEIRIPVQVNHKGVLAIPADALSSFLNSLTEPYSLTLSSDDHSLTIRAKNLDTKIKLHPHDDFPSLPVVSKGTSLSIARESLIQGFKSVMYSASVSSMKPELSSVYVGLDNGMFVFAATDSFRLAEKKIKAGKDTGSFSSLLVPIRNILEIIRTLEQGGGDDTVVMYFNENQLSFSYGNTLLTSRVIDGTFPDYGQIIPKEFASEAVVLKQDVVNAFKTAHIFLNRFNQTILTLIPKQKQLKLETHNPDRGESQSYMEAAITGDELTIGFNYKYITDCFPSLKTDSITLRFAGIGKPLLITGVGDTSFTYLVMPMSK